MERRIKLKFQFAHSAVLGFVFAVATFSSSGGAFAVDEEAVKALMKKSDCTKCHAADKDKNGPAYKKIAAKFKGKADAEESVTKFLTTGSKVKLTDGTEEAHKIINTKDAKEIKNVVQWILAQ
jgi:cytochrome c